MVQFNSLRRRTAITLRWVGAIAAMFVSFQVHAAGEASAPENSSSESIDVLLVVGAGGTEEYAAAFESWAERWQQICERSEKQMRRIGAGSNDDPSDREKLQAALMQISNADTARPLWIVLIGHGTWDGKTANFNLAGPDVSAHELDQWLGTVQRPVVLVNCSSSSGPFIDRLSGPNRVVLTATKSGSEQNYSRFGDFFSAAFTSSAADVDHDDAISVREAFVKASSDVDRFYKEQGRLATEHALLDDNGDRKGSDDSLVAGKATAKNKQAVDGDVANRFSIPAPGNTLRLSDEQIKRRDQLETKLDEIQQQFSTNEQADALRKQALPVLLQLAELYDEAERGGGTRKGEQGEDVSSGDGGE